MENADPVALKVYQEEAKQIENIRKGILEVSSSEQPYDIFICYKETDVKGSRTVDSLLAQDIYDALAKEHCVNLDSFVRKRLEATQNVKTEQCQVEQNAAYVEEKVKFFCGNGFGDAAAIREIYDADLRYPTNHRLHLRNMKLRSPL